MTTCSIDGCENGVEARGWCAMHYRRWQRHGDPAYQRPKPDCSIEDCTKQAIARGWCDMHWQRWRKHGDPLALRNYGDPEADFLARTEPLVGEPAHIIWTGAVNRKGYGVLHVNGRARYAHRFAWERANGPIPDGLHVDHACWEPSCVNVDHLRLATPQQNTWNRSGAMPGRGLPRGVYRTGRRYVARIGHNGANLYLGTFDTPEEAAAVASAKRKELFGEFAGAA